MANRFEKCKKCVHYSLPKWMNICYECGECNEDSSSNVVKDNFLLNTTIAEVVAEPPAQQASTNCEECDNNCRCCVHCFNDYSECARDFGCRYSSMFERAKHIKYCFMTGKKVEG